MCSISGVLFIVIGNSQDYSRSNPVYAFPIALIYLGKECVQLFYPHLGADCRVDVSLSRCVGNSSMERENSKYKVTQLTN